MDTRVPLTSPKTDFFLRILGNLKFTKVQPAPLFVGPGPGIFTFTQNGQHNSPITFENPFDFKTQNRNWTNIGQVFFFYFSLVKMKISFSHPAPAPMRRAKNMQNIQFPAILFSQNQLCEYKWI